MNYKKYVYEKPLAEVIKIESEDIVTCSDCYENKPGHGWGDKNHNHHHWKDGDYDDDYDYDRQ